MSALPAADAAARASAYVTLAPWWQLAAVTAFAVALLLGALYVGTRRGVLAARSSGVDRLSGPVVALLVAAAFVAAPGVVDQVAQPGASDHVADVEPASGQPR